MNDQTTLMSKERVDTILVHTNKTYIPSTVSEQDLLTQGNLPSHFDPDTKTVHVSPEMRAPQVDLENNLASLLVSDPQ